MNKEPTEQPCEELFTPPAYSEQMNNYLVNLCEQLEAERDELKAEIAELVTALEHARPFLHGNTHSGYAAILVNKALAKGEK